ncbi:50S ribosomal protein L24 [Candidatus Pacearchaeota archaeon]|jgi:large subunit ribosomal protein L24|nr:50S ribosomal protein L24 [Candidatus Pacearchaeota archaeon]|tara:strand:+ start:27498 stop:27917 length:420 start_codon:yes stop_codon:yes gene_type:complete
MRSLFNKTWNSSVQPRKQRKYLANAPNHLRQKLLSAILDRELRTKHGIRSIAIRKNDEVKVMRGKFSKKQGKVLAVSLRDARVQVEGIEIAKKSGDKIAVWLRPSNLKIIKLDDSDKKRLKNVKKEVKKETKPKTPEKK